MDILRNLFGNLTSGIIRLAVTVGVLLARRLPLHRQAGPDTTTGPNTTDEAFKSSGLDRDRQDARTASTARSSAQIRRSFEAAKPQGGNPKKLVHCIQQRGQRATSHTIADAARGVLSETLQARQAARWPK